MSASQPVVHPFAPQKGMSEAAIESAIEGILAAATLDEKVAMVSGKGFFKLFKASGKRWGADPYPAGSGLERFGVPPLYFTDGPRGVARGSSTCFPCTMARGASFDVSLEQRIGEAMGVEARAQGCTLSGAVCINLLRHPAWGRAQETYGEDTHHLGEMGAALAQGIQTHNVIATVKHFALNSMENARFKVDVLCDDRTMRELYLPHFKRVLDAGCASVMSAYNKWNGAYCGENRTLLTEILRDEWRFDGFVHSDWVMGVYDVMGLVAGLDIENPEPRVFGDNLRNAIEDGRIASQVLDLAVRRILRVQYRFAAAADPLPDYPMSLVASAQHRALAREAALKSAVLLKNNGVLPFDRTKIMRLAVLGRLANLENTGDNGSSRVQPPYVVTPLAGLQAALPEGAVLTADSEDVDGVMDAITQADAVVIVAGYTAREEGEFIPGDGIDLGQGDGGTSQFMSRKSVGGDRRHLGLPQDQIELIKLAASVGKPVCVVLVAGSAVLVEDWLDDAGAILQTFYAGMEGGAALAELLFGLASPSGRLPFTVARTASDYPDLDIDADTIVYGPFAGYTHFDAQNVEPRFSFGHGLSYAQFSCDQPSVRLSADSIAIELDVTNLAPQPADAVLLAFIHPPAGDAQRPRRQLKGFVREQIPGAGRATASITITKDSLRRWDSASRSWQLDPGHYRVTISSPSDEVEVAFAI